MALQLSSDVEFNFVHQRALNAYDSMFSPEKDSSMYINRLIDYGALYDARDMVIKRGDQHYALSSSTKKAIVKRYTDEVQKWIQSTANQTLRKFVLLMFRTKWPSPLTLWTLETELSQRCIEFLVERLPGVLFKTSHTLSVEVYLLMCLTRYAFSPKIDKRPFVEMFTKEVDLPETPVAHILKARTLSYGKTVLNDAPNHSMEYTAQLIQFFLKPRIYYVPVNDYVAIGNWIKLTKYETAHETDVQFGQSIKRNSDFAFPPIKPKKQVEGLYQPLVLYKYEISLIK